MEQWKERLLEEFKQLDIRVEKLIKFLDNTKIIIFYVNNYLL